MANSLMNSLVASVASSLAVSLAVSQSRAALGGPDGARQVPGSSRITRTVPSGVTGGIPSCLTGGVPIRIPARVSGEFRRSASEGASSEREVQVDVQVKLDLDEEETGEQQQQKVKRKKKRGRNKGRRRVGNEVAPRGRPTALTLGSGASYSGASTSVDSTGGASPSGGGTSGTSTSGASTSGASTSGASTSGCRVSGGTGHREVGGHGCHGRRGCLAHGGRLRGEVRVTKRVTFKDFLNDEGDGELCKMCRADSGKYCSGCHLVNYCSKECQKQDWSDHKAICGRRPM